MSVLFISCWSLHEPQCQRLNLEPLRRLARLGYRVALMTFERAPYRGTRKQEGQWRAALALEGIAWEPVAYHHRPLLLAKAWDGLVACAVGWRLMRRHHVRFVHARSEFPAMIAVVLKGLTGRPVLYESDAPISEERIDTGVWRPQGFVARVTAAFERWLPRHAAAMVVLSHRYAQRLQAQGVRVPITVIPSCTDVERFQRDEAARERLRQAQGWQQKLVLIYSGSFGGWYRVEEMAAFFALLHGTLPQAHWLCLVNEHPQRVQAVLRQYAVPPEAVTVRSVPSEEVAQWLSASDIALSFIRAGTSKYASSPTKTAEYLACGLPVLMTPGIGDTEALVSEPVVGHILQAFDEGAYQQAVEWVRWIAPQLASAIEPCRRVAVEQLSVQRVGVPRYHALYQSLAGAPAGSMSPDDPSFAATESSIACAPTS